MNVRRYDGSYRKNPISESGIDSFPRWRLRSFSLLPNLVMLILLAFAILFKPLSIRAQGQGNGLMAPNVASEPASQSVVAGQTATFSVSTVATPPPKYQWLKNGLPISGATSSIYTTPPATSADNGALFSVVASNKLGSVTSNAATLTVSIAPSITNQPTSQTVTAGQTATFTVAATGTSPLSYQWQENGTAIIGATASYYTTPATTISDTGAQFTVVVSNSAGSATSSGATLTVNNSTGLLNPSMTSLSFGSVTIGSSNSLNVTFENAGNSNVTISNVSISGAGYAASGVSTGQILTPGQTATLNVTFSPASTGTLTGSATVSSDATNSPSTISLTGSGVQPVTHSVALTWSPSTSSVIGYNIYRSTVSGSSYTKLNSTTLATTSYDDSNVQAGQTYYYVVTSVDSSNTESSYSPQVFATIPTP